MIARIKRPIISSIIRGVINKGSIPASFWIDGEPWIDGDLWIDGQQALYGPNLIPNGNLLSDSTVGWNVFNSTINISSGTAVLKGDSGTSGRLEFNVSGLVVDGNYQFYIEYYVNNDGNQALKQFVGFIESPDIPLDSLTVDTKVLSLAPLSTAANIKVYVGAPGDQVIITGISLRQILSYAPVIPEPPDVCVELPDSTDPIPFNVGGDGQLYFRGTHSNWEPLEEFRMKYKGGNTYQMIANLMGPIQFKIASSDGQFAVQVWVENDAGTGIKIDDIALGVIYDVAYLDGGLQNNQGSFISGLYNVILQLNEPDPSQGFDIGTISIRLCSDV
tara:strand:+ start:3541 stop:4536 length:996 start_codon:yes stop_codon:yes gene_type:complete